MCGFRPAGQMAVTDAAYLLSGIEEEGAITHYVYRAGVRRAEKEVAADDLRQIGVQFFYVTREYEEDAKTKKKANGVKYDYFQKNLNVTVPLTSFGDFYKNNDPEHVSDYDIMQYGTSGIANVTIVNSFNAKKYKDNKLVSDNKYKTFDFNSNTLHLNRKPKENVSYMIYNENKIGLLQILLVGMMAKK